MILRVQKKTNQNSISAPQDAKTGAPSSAKSLKQPSFPEWLRRPIPHRGEKETVERILKQHKLATVCVEAKCPNRGECYCNGTATFMIMGEVCSRNCGFCSVSSGTLDGLDPGEPERLASAAAQMNLRHVVVTSVTRDDLPDGGAGHFAATVAAIKEKLPKATVEVLTPDFNGSTEALRTVLASSPDVFNHNVETVPRLYTSIRPQADYKQSLHVLETAHELSPETPVKSGLMVGLGETKEEVIEVFRDLHRHGCSMLTVGQYLRPSSKQAPVVEYVSPELFEHYREIAMGIGFAHVASAPFVRSSYHAEEGVRSKT